MMQRETDKNVHLDQTVSCRISKSSAIDRTVSDFDNANKKVKKIKKLIYSGEYDVGIASHALYSERFN